MNKLTRSCRYGTSRHICGAAKHCCGVPPCSRIAAGAAATRHRLQALEHSNDSRPARHRHKQTGAGGCSAFNTAGHLWNAHCCSRRPPGEAAAARMSGRHASTRRVQHSTLAPDFNAAMQGPAQDCSHAMASHPLSTPQALHGFQVLAHHLMYHDVSSDSAHPAAILLQVLDKAFFLGLLKTRRAEVAAATRELEEDVAGADQRQAAAARLDKRVAELQVCVDGMHHDHAKATLPPSPSCPEWHDADDYSSPVQPQAQQAQQAHNRLAYRTLTCASPAAAAAPVQMPLLPVVGKRSSIPPATSRHRRCPSFTLLH